MARTNALVAGVACLFTVVIVSVPAGEGRARANSSVRVRARCSCPAREPGLVGAFHAIVAARAVPVECNFTDHLVRAFVGISVAGVAAIALGACVRAFVVTAACVLVSSLVGLIFVPFALVGVLP